MRGKTNISLRKGRNFQRSWNRPLKNYRLRIATLVIDPVFHRLDIAQQKMLAWGPVPTVVSRGPQSLEGLGGTLVPPVPPNWRDLWRPVSRALGFHRMTGDLKLEGLVGTWFEKGPSSPSFCAVHICACNVRLLDRSPVFENVQTFSLSGSFTPFSAFPF